MHKAFGKGLIMLSLALFLLKLCAKLNLALKNEKNQASLRLCDLAVNISG
jgi:hypothetical protein